MAEFDADTQGFAMGPRYEGADPSCVRPWMITVRGNNTSRASRVRVFLPVYETTPGRYPFSGIRFVGIRVAQGYEKAFKGLYRVANLKDFRLLPTVMLSEDASEFQYCHTLPATPRKFFLALPA